jgi:D-3-phosphoglycerate dehydrogenase / 2-oxoglutarate reductase
MSADDNNGLILLPPHRFPNLDDEMRLAVEFGLCVHVADSQRGFVDRIPEAKLIMMTPYGTLDAEAVKRAERCIAIVRYGVGVDNIDIEEAARQNIPVANVPAAATEEVAVSAVTMGLSLLRRLPQADAALRGGSWTGTLMNGVPRISELTVGVVGTGRIGTLVGRYWEAFGVRVVTHELSDRETPWPNVSFDEIVDTADVISLHVPRTPETANMLSRERIARLKPHAVVVNVARGGLVDEEALAEALTEGRLGGVALDTFAVEPPDPRHPIFSAPNTLLTGHLSWRSDDSVRDYQRLAIEAARDALSGKRMQTIVNGL